MISLGKEKTKTMKIIRSGSDKVACTGDLLVISQEDDADTYLLFCESERSKRENENDKFYYQLVDMSNGFVIDYELGEDEDINIGIHIEGYGEVIDIINSHRLALRISD